MTVEADDPRLSFVPIEKATELKPNLCMVYKDLFWAVHPEKGLVFWTPNKKTRAPQCNSNRIVTEEIVARMYPWAEVKQIPWVIERTTPSEWCA